MKKILYSVGIALIIITMILAYTNPGMLDFTDYLKKQNSYDRLPNEIIHRENYFIFSTYSQLGGAAVDEKVWQGYNYGYIGVLGRFYLSKSIIIN